MKRLDKLVRELPPELQHEVYDFAQFLHENRAQSKRKGKLRLTWAGGLREYRDQYSSLDLQRKALEWWGD